MDGNKLIAQLYTQKRHYQKLIIRFEEEMKQMPKGSINYKTKNGHVYFYHYYVTEKEERKQKYIPKNENQLITKLCRKRFIQLSLASLQKNILEIERFLKGFKPYEVNDILSEIPVALSDIDYAMQKNNVGWENERYEKSELYPEGLIHGTVGGLKVRSKSEAIIAGLLEINNVPFRYEATLHLGDRTYFPDFTILKPRDNKILYWEHFGMADDEEYIFSMEKKMATYRRHGIVPWNQLITTFEIKRGSIDAQDIQSIINAFIL